MNQPFNSQNPILRRYNIIVLYMNILMHNSLGHNDAAGENGSIVEWQRQRKFSYVSPTSELSFVTYVGIINSYVGLLNSNVGLANFYVVLDDS